MTKAEEKRMISLAITILSASPDKISAIKAPLAIKMRAIDLGIERLCNARDAVCSMKEGSTHKFVQTGVAAALEFRRRELNLTRRARRKRTYTKEERAAHAAGCLERAKEKTAMAKLGRVVTSLFDTIKIGGKPVGNVWYSELSAIRKAGTFEAALAHQILTHAKPSEDIKVRDMINEKVLVKMVAAANEAADRTMKLKAA